MCVAGSLGIVPMWVLIGSTPRTLSGCCAVALLGGFFATQTGPNIRATLANVTSTEQRGRAFATFTLFDDVGKGAGPVAVAALVHSFGRGQAFAWAMVGWLPCALLCGCTALTVVRDEARAQLALRSRGMLMDEDAGRARDA